MRPGGSVREHRCTQCFSGACEPSETAAVKTSTFLALHLGCAAMGAIALWWFVFRNQPAEAIADSMTAAAFAGYIEIVAMRLWG
jgi:hypothetical protein